MPRSGTTFAGRVLSAPLAVDYIHEPFNPDCGIVGLDQLLVHTRPGAPNEPEVRRAVDDLLHYRARLRTGHFVRDGAVKGAVKRVVGSRGPFHYRLARANPFHEVALVKEPVGCLLLEYLVTEHGFDAALFVRHPLGITHSFGRLGWDPARHLDALRAQPWFVETLDPDDRRLLHRRQDDQTAAVAVLWRILHRALGDQAERTGTPVHTHEALSSTPVATFRGLYEHFDLGWTPRIEARVRKATGGDDALAARSGPTQQLTRDAAGIAAAVLEATPEPQRRQVWDITAPVATRWYDEATFGL
jgi:hypothetical protein